MAAKPQPKDHIVTAIGHAYHWQQRLTQENLTIPELANRLNVSNSLIRKYLPLTNLSPQILKCALTGNLPPSRTLLNLLSAAQHLDWQKQATYLPGPRAVELPHERASAHAKLNPMRCFPKRTAKTAQRDVLPNRPRSRGKTVSASTAREPANLQIPAEICPI